MSNLENGIIEDERFNGLEDDEVIDIVSKEILERYLPAFKELAK